MMSQPHHSIALSLALVLVAANTASCTGKSPDSISPGAGAGGDSSGPPPDDVTVGSGLAAGAGGESSLGSGPPAGPSLPCDVDAVLQDCRGCHGEKPAFGAPMPLVTYADLMAPAPSDPGKKVAELVKARIHDDAHPMPPLPNPRVDASKMAVVDTWLSAGAPVSNVDCGGGDGGGKGGAEPPGPKPLSCAPDTLIRPAAPFAIDPGSIDQYVCYGFDVTPSKKRHVTALAPKIDNKALVHHLLLFQTDQAESPTPKACQAFGSVGWRLIAGWAPGGDNLELPPEAGFPEAGTTHWVMQVHYNNSQHLANQTDESGYDLCTTDQLRPNDAEVMGLGSINFSIEPHSKLDLSCDYTFYSSPKIHLFGASPHMHLRGRAMSSVKLGGPMGQQTIVDSPNFDFNTQIEYPTSVDVAFGDTLRTRCVWENDTASAIKFGENTGDEMCFDFVAYYPKVTAPLWSWTTPSLSASCKSQ